MLEIYKDLWRSDDDCENRQSYGLANENVQKLISGDDSANKTAKTDGVLDSTIAITLPKSEKIMEAQTNETTGNYTLTDMRLEYEIIESEQFASDVRGGFNLGRSLGYDYTRLLKTLPWSKDSTREVIDINIRRKSMKAVVFTKKMPEIAKSLFFPI